VAQSAIPNPDSDSNPNPFAAMDQKKTSHYVVFFEYGQSKPNKLAKETIADAVVEKKEQQLSRYELTGRSDDTGTRNKNERLAERRAEQVKNEITRLDPKGIVMTQKVEAHRISPMAEPLAEDIQTLKHKQPLPKDGASQSRRVDIVLKN
jgi:outer membrane protein OmpA-like peptidoglycan-associated protein